MSIMNVASARSNDDPESRPLRRVALPDLAAQRIWQFILDNQLKPGDPLPTQQELAERYGVSRTVVREAVRMLVQQGLLEVRPGRGMTVATPSFETLVQQLTVLLRTNQATADQLFELRIVLEPAIAAAAARERNADDVRILEHVLAESELSVDDVSAFCECDLELNRALAEATHNPFYVAASMPIEAVLKNTYRTALAHMHPHYAYTLSEHRSILNAVVERDSEAAATASRRHLERVSRSLRRILEEERAASQP